MARGAFLCLLVAACMTGGALACSCMPTHPQTHYCFADFVVRAKVVDGPHLYQPDGVPSPEPEPEADGLPVYELPTDASLERTTLPPLPGQDDTPSTDVHRYRISISKNFKGQLGKDVDPSNVYTMAETSLCGIDKELKAGQLYLLAGYIYKNKMHVGLCSWVSPWEEVTEKQRRGLKYMYRDNCECAIQPCLRGKTCTPWDDKTCLWDDMHTTDCTRRLSACVKNSATDSCSWFVHQAMRDCTSPISPEAAGNIPEIPQLPEVDEPFYPQVDTLLPRPAGGNGVVNGGNDVDREIERFEDSSNEVDPVAYPVEKADDYLDESIDVWLGRWGIDGGAP
ncbi:Metalloproteinase inhibitor 3 [Branchiostoma belcheri]|nr:Metalloproteinase inhibitor 3 [Branchiostoma belcheri]